MIARFFSKDSKSANKLFAGALLALVTILSMIALPSCLEQIPEKVPLTQGGEQVELVSDTPNTDVYIEIGEVVGKAVGTEKGDAFSAARNAARNQTAQKNGSILRIDNVDARLQWETRQTVVTVTGTAFRTK